MALNTAQVRMDYSFSELELAKKLAEMENKRFLAGDSNLLLLNIREQNLADFQKSSNDDRVSTGIGLGDGH